MTQTIHSKSQIDHSCAGDFEIISPILYREGIGNYRSFLWRQTLPRFAILPLLLLTACADMSYQPPGMEAVTGTARFPEQKPAGVKPVDPRAAAPRPPRPRPTTASQGAQPAPPATAPETAAVQTPETVEPPAAPMKLTGLTQRETLALLGRPVSETDQPPAKVWRYRGTGCTLDLFFYLDLQRNEFFALHQAIDGARDATGQQSCIAGVRRDAHAR